MGEGQWAMVWSQSSVTIDKRPQTIAHRPHDFWLFPSDIDDELTPIVREMIVVHAEIQPS